MAGGGAVLVAGGGAVLVIFPLVCVMAGGRSVIILMHVCHVHHVHRASGIMHMHNCAYAYI